MIRSDFVVEQHALTDRPVEHRGDAEPYRSWSV